LAALAAAADIIFIAVPDRQIAAATHALKKYPHKNKIICHAKSKITL
jgi:prephenate dehydrogenase